MTDNPTTIRATVTEINKREIPDPPRHYIRWWNEEKWCVAAGGREDFDDLCRTMYRRVDLIDTQPEPQPAENEAVIAELEKLVPKICWRCAEGHGWTNSRRVYHPPLGANLFATRCPAADIHAGIAELRGESE